MSEEKLFVLIMDTQERVKNLEDKMPKQDWKDHVTTSLDFLMGKYSKFEGEFDLMSHRMTRMDDDIQILKINTAKIMANLEKINSKLEIV